MASKRCTNQNPTKGHIPRPPLIKIQRNTPPFVHLLAAGWYPDPTVVTRTTLSWLDYTKHGFEIEDISESTLERVIHW